jgi:hypothetical membrane protein
MMFFVGILIFILVYVVVKFLFEKVPSLAGLAEILGIVVGALAALVYVGALK